MAIRNIREENDEVLRKKSKKVTDFDDKLGLILKDMEDTMLNEDGVGIAAIQIGVLRRIFLADLDDKIVEFINPIILEKKGTQINEEACLSVQNKNGEVERPEYIKIEALNRKGEKFVYEAEGMEAVIIEHEYDHLDGILYIDKII